MRHTK